MDFDIVSIEEELLPLPRNENFLSLACIRFLVFWRDGFQCVYCGKSRAEAPKIRLYLEQVLPKSAGGSDTFDNLVTACALCNAGKLDARLDQRTRNLIQTIIKQNNERFLELNDSSLRARLEAALDGQSLGRKRVVVRVDGEEYFIVHWSDSSMALKGIHAETAMTFATVYDFWADDRHNPKKDPSMMTLEALLTSRGVQPNEIRGFDAEREEAFQIVHRATMKAYKERNKILEEKLATQAAPQGGKVKNKRLSRKDNNDA